MRSLTLHLKLLIAILVVLGISVTAYQIFVLGIPVTEDATDDLWNIDASRRIGPGAPLTQTAFLLNPTNGSASRSVQLTPPLDAALGPF